jgi:Protein of unknown function (DUF4242)
MEFLVERYVPGLSEADVKAVADRARVVCEGMTAEGTDIRYLGSTFLPDEEACFCRFEARSAAVVAKANQRAEIPFARIVAARRVQPTLSERSRT